MFRKLGVAAAVSGDPAELHRASHLVLPGVGSFDAGMSSLRKTGLEAVLADLVNGRKIPILGICLGMQLLTDNSEEGDLPGLGWVKGRTMRFRGEAMDGLKIPHMGWNSVRAARPNPLIPAEAVEDPRFYFVHSYHVVPDDASVVIGRTRYGAEFVSAVSQGNIHGVQFHPEKSHQYGLALLRGFAEHA